LPCPISTTTSPAQNTPVPAQYMQKKELQLPNKSLPLIFGFVVDASGEDPNCMSMIANED